MKLSTVSYRVMATIVVDRPELRSKSFAPVRPGSYSPFSRTFNDLNGGRVAAHAFHAAILAGEYDFGSEYVRHVQIVRDDLHSGRRYQDRKLVERSRAKTGRVYAIAA